MGAWNNDAPLVPTHNTTSPLISSPTTQHTAELLSTLPPENHAVVERVVRLLAAISARSDTNGMTVENIAIWCVVEAGVSMRAKLCTARATRCGGTRSMAIDELAPPSPGHGAPPRLCLTHELSLTVTQIAASMS